MNIVTKIFVVLSLVTSIVLVVFVALVLGTAKEQKTALDNANIGMRSSSILLLAERAKNADMQVNSDKERARLETNIADLTKQKTDMLAANTSLQANLASVNAQLDQANNTVQRTAVTMSALQNANDLKDKELAFLRPENVRTNKEISETNRANEELQTKLDQAERGIKRLQEQLVESTKPATGASNDSIGGAATLTTGIVSPVPINGHVVEIKNANGKTYLALSLGERDNVVVGTRFIISRGEKYIGDAVVERVAPDQSVAVVKAGNPLPVQVNDLASSGQ